MDNSSQFKTFISNITPSNPQKEAWRLGHKTLRERLLNDPDLKEIIINTFLQGSIRRSTDIKPQGDKRPDVDIVVVTRIDSNVTSASEALKLFHPFLNKYYKGKWKPQDRSLAIELGYVDMDIVVTALPSLQNLRLYEAFYGSKSISSDDTVGEEPEWLLNESWAGDVSKVGFIENPKNKDWKSHPILLPDRSVEKWTRTHPIAQIDWTSQKNKRTNGHYTNIVRAIKWWRQINSDTLPKYPKGYPLEHIIGYCCPDGVTSLAEGFTKALEKAKLEFSPYIQLAQLPILSDHGVPEHNVLKRVSFSEFKDFLEAISELSDQARIALNETDKDLSSKKWFDIFGGEFPKPSSGFIEPSKPASPPPQRFA
ncbi:MAG: hypothetical protein RL204_60 [Bacteroidota bacterium]|jgi:hypothetical protein